MPHSLSRICGRKDDRPGFRRDGTQGEATALRLPEDLTIE